MNPFGEDPFTKESLVFREVIKLVSEASERNDGHSLACFTEDKI
jgi:hypothetical protein